MKRPRSLKLTKPLRLREIDLPLETTADVRRLLKHLPAEYRQQRTWRHVEREIEEAEESGETLSVTVALKMVLMMTNLLDSRPL